MKVERPKENWTKFPNCILDNLEKFTHTEFKVIAFMVRKNFGWNNPNKEFSIRYLSANTGISKPSIISAVEGLEKKQSIINVGTGQRGLKKYEINWSDPLVKEIDQSIKLTSTGKNALPDVVKEIDQVLETNIKKPIKETINVEDFQPYYNYAFLLWQQHCKHDEKFLNGTDKEKTFIRWSKDIRLLHEKDGRSLEDIESVIKWCQSPGNFWIPNILSGKKLREKFPTLYSQMNNQNKRPKLRVNDVEGF
jgi:hypothetical protein